MDPAVEELIVEAGRFVRSTISAGQRDTATAPLRFPAAAAAAFVNHYNAWPSWNGRRSNLSTDHVMLPIRARANLPQRKRVQTRANKSQFH